MEHQLQAYPLAEPVIHRKRPLTLDHRKVMKEKVFEWMREGMFRRVQHPGWLANAVPIKQRNGTWQMQMDYTSLNKVCAKDMYPFSKMEEEIGSLIGYKYKCFLQLPKEHRQVQMLEIGVEKTRFHIEEGVYYFTYMPKGLKNSVATLQRMMDKVPDHTSSQSLNPKAEALTGLASIILEFLNQEVSVGVKTSPSVEAAGRSPKEARNVAKKATTGKLSPTWEDQSGSN
nr:hypothetical protein [Tanacetum cinerariifolium]